MGDGSSRDPSAGANRVRVVIVDDEPPARRELRRLLSVEAGVKVVGEAASVEEAAALLSRETPDLVFLDVRLRDGSGLDIVSKVPPRTAIVFVTAFDEYAIRAFEVNALDYLLKPVESERLTLALRRVADRETRVPPPPRAPVLESGDWLFLRSEHDAGFLSVEEISTIVACADYSIVRNSHGKERMVHVSLNDWERRLPPGDFARIHRSAIVNLRSVLSVEPVASGGYLVHVRGDAKPLTMSRRFAFRLKRRLGLPRGRTPRHLSHFRP